MNAQGLTAMFGGVSSALNFAFYQNLVTNGSITQAELDGTRKDLARVIQTLKNTPGEKIEALVDQYNAQLSAHLDKFNSEWTQEDPLSAFRDAQTMAGFVSTIMAKSGLTE